MSTYSDIDVRSRQKRFLVAGTLDQCPSRGERTPAEATPTTRALIVKAQPDSQPFGRSESWRPRQPLIPEELPAVTVPPGRARHRFELSQLLQCGVRPGCSSMLLPPSSSFQSLHRQRDDFLGEASLCSREPRAVGCVAPSHPDRHVTDLIFLSDVLCGDAERIDSRMRPSFWIRPRRHPIVVYGDLHVA